MLGVARVRKKDHPKGQSSDTNSSKGEWKVHHINSKGEGTAPERQRSDTGNNKVLGKGVKEKKRMSVYPTKRRRQGGVDDQLGCGKGRIHFEKKRTKKRPARSVGKGVPINTSGR